MNKSCFLLLVLSISWYVSFGQAVVPEFYYKKQIEADNNIGVDVQGYPTGAIITLRYEHGFQTLNHAISIRAGYNIVRHRDLGKHDDERGRGAGFSLGYSYYFKEPLRGFFIGAKADLWFNKLDWKSESNSANETSGTTDIIVLQPRLKLAIAGQWLTTISV